MNKRMMQMMLVVWVAILALAAGHFTRSAQHEAPAATDIDPQAQARAVVEMLAETLPDPDGTPRRIADWQGTLRVVNYWATWCPPCIKEIPDLVSISREYADRPVTVVGLAIDNAEAVAAFQKRFDIPYPILLGSAASLNRATALGNPSRGLPFTLFIAPDDRLLEVHLGLIDADELRRRLDRFLM